MDFDKLEKNKKFENFDILITNTSSNEKLHNTKDIVVILGKIYL
jgi:hypothetical protein